MKIIHCSDIHLDSRMESNLTAAQARERNAEICASFGRMVDYAAEKGVEAVLIAGDMFDTRRFSARTADFVASRIREAQNVTFYYLRGNHGEHSQAFEELEMSENFKTFGSGWTSWRQNDVVITGLELGRDNWDNMYDSLNLSDSDANIVMLHGMEATQPGPDEIAIPRLRGKHIDYLALGHIHSYKLEKLDEDGVYCYCGCLEGRGFDECGEKGFVVLDIENHRVKTEFVPFASRRLHEVQVDISGLTTVTEIRSAMERLSVQIPAEDLVKFTLTGTYTPDTQKDLNFLKKMMEPRFWFVKIKDESRLKIDRESYEHDVSLKGEFIRMVMASDKSEEEKEAIILCGLRALAGEEVEL